MESDSGDPADLRALLRSRRLEVVLQPQFELARSPRVICHALQVQVRGPVDSTFASSSVLLTRVRQEGLEAEVDRFGASVALREAVRLPDGTALWLTAHTTTLARGEGFPSFLEGACATAAILPAQIILEIRGEGHAGDILLSMAKLRNLRRQGLRIAFDDPGLLRSEAVRIDALHPDYLKLDRSYISGLDRDPGRSEALATLIGRCLASGVLCAADGVETAEELAVLREIGVQLAQGPLFAAPRPARELGGFDPAEAPDPSPAGGTADGTILRAILDTVPGAIYRYHEEARARRFSFISRGVEELIGVPADRIVADLASFVERILPEDREHMAAMAGLSTRTLSRWTTEFRVRTPDGFIKWLRGSAVPERLDDGGFAWSGIFTDVTELKRIEQELAKVRNEWRETVDAVSAMILLVDADGNVVRCNQAVPELLGVGFPRILGRNLSRLFFGPEAEPDNPVFRSAPAVLRFPGREGWYEVSNYPLDGGGWVHVIADVTERRRAEAVAEGVNLMDHVGFIFASLRHELGNPVNSIKTALSVLRDRLDEYPRDTVADYLDRCLAEIARVEFLLKAFKTFNMFEQQRAEPLDVRSFLGQTATLFSDDLRSRSIVFEAGSGEGLGCLLADPRALYQVLLNLVANAADAVAGRSEPRIRLRAERQGRWVVLALEDNGVGMTPAQQANLFRPFFTDKPNGNGLGLAIVKKLVARMGGTVEVDSRSEVGTIVTLSLLSADNAEIPS
jgi:PAS domain S-box-containing protein